MSQQFEGTAATAASQDVTGDEIEISDGSDENTTPEPSSNPSNGGGGASSTSAKRKRKTTSSVWKYFKKIEVEGEEVVKQVQCTYCNQIYSYAPGGTTSTMQRHIKGCGNIERSKGKTSSLIPISEHQDESEVISKSWGKYCHLKSREMLAKMITVHELPFMFTEYQWFNSFMKYNNPMYQKVSRNTIKKECAKVFLSEKEKLKKIFRNVDKISLTSDCWTSNQTIGYMSLTAHYIDADWNLQKRIISFSDLSPPHSGEVIADAIMAVVTDWGIENKIGTITLDNASNNDKAASLLRLGFEARDKLHFKGFFFHIRCCAHILNLVVQDGLSKIENCLCKIRDGVKYLKKSTGRLIKFKEIAVQLGITTKRALCLDVKTRWNSTYFMLEAALLYKKAFTGYALRDSNFEWLPSEAEWENAEKVCKLLEVFGDTTNLFSGTSYPTSNLFLVETFNVKKAIYDAYLAEDGFTHDMSIAMYEKFEKYWGEVNILMAVASFLDPRLKMVSIKFIYRRLYPSDEVDARVNDVVDKIKALFEIYSKEYVASTGSAGPSNTRAVDKSSSTCGRNDFWQYLESTWDDNGSTSELDEYHKEPVF